MLQPTILFGVDGATFTVLDPLMDDGVMPFLRRLIAEGVRAELLSTPNPLTAPAWTSLVTGHNPGRHGIFDFVRVEERGDDLYFTLHDFRDIHSETIWSIVSRNQGRAISLNFPLMAPPAPICGSLVPGLVSWKYLRSNVYPADLYGRLETLPGFSAKEVAWDFDAERNALKEIPDEQYEGWVRYHMRRDNHWFGILRYLMRTDPVDLTAILLDGTDKLQHICWRFLDPELLPKDLSGWEWTIRQLCLEYFRQLDAYLSETVALAGPDARIFIVSDHGFGPTETVFRVNTWLHQQGYLTWKDTDSLDDAARRSVERRLNSDVALVDLKNTKAYGRTSASNGIVIRMAEGAGSGGVAPHEYLDFRSRLIDQLLAIREPETGEPFVTRVLVREQAFPGEECGRAPDLTLVLRDGGFVSILDKEPVFLKRRTIVGTHRPEGVLIASGPGIRRGARINALSILDVPSALLYSLGVAIPEDFEGRLPAELFEPSLLAASPPRIGALTCPPRLHDGPSSDAAGSAYDADDEAIIGERLRALGYLE